ncbi:MAG: ribosome maturation factor RimM [Zoogloeaceae bacterium]|jgi:16S rRNA processing protein RimM|nr:ribosome maturation factor RimM [Zoogloeaceae bacterium]
MVILGRIAAPYGVRGWVKVLIFGDALESWMDMPCWWLCAQETAADSAWQTKSIAECRVHGKGLVVRFEGVEDRDQAALLSGLHVGAPREALPETAPDEYYWADLIGLAVVNLAGENLGHVAGLARSGAHEVLDVRNENGRQRLLPFVAAIIRKVDLTERRIEVAWESDW